MAWNASFRIFDAFKNLIFHPDINKLGGPVAIYKASSEAAKGGIESVIALLAMLSLNIGILISFLSRRLTVEKLCSICLKPFVVNH